MEGAPEIKLPRFEGPLDLLLYLIRQQEIDIHDIPIREITRQYLETLETMQSLNLEVAGEFILMVAYLLHIKAQMLLPRPQVEEEEDPRTPLVQKLIEYQKFKQIGEELKRLEIERLQFFPRRFDPSIIGQLDELQIDFSLYDLYRAYIWAVRGSEDYLPATVPRSRVDIDERIAYIMSKILNLNKITFVELTEGLSRIQLVGTFLALLEMVKLGMLKLKQAKLFGNITIIAVENVES